MTPDPIQPALTPSEWEGCETLWPVAALSTTGGGDLMVSSFVEIQGREAYVEVPDNYRHAVAALALYQQPFGFTQADVRMLRRLHRDVRLTHEDMQTGEITEPLESLASRIAALLPLLPPSDSEAP